MDIRPIYNLSPAWPSLMPSDEEWMDTFCKLEAFLQKRLQNREAMATSAREKSKTFNRLSNKRCSKVRQSCFQETFQRNKFNSFPSHLES